MLEESQSPKHQLPKLSDRVFNARHASKPLLVIQFVTENVTGKTYFRLISPNGKIEGWAGTAEEAAPLAENISKRLGLEIHDEIIAISL
jgi:hypothetical protein